MCFVWSGLFTGLGSSSFSLPSQMLRLMLSGTNWVFSCWMSGLKTQDYLTTCSWNLYWMRTWKCITCTAQVDMELCFYLVVPRWEILVRSSLAKLHLVIRNQILGPYWTLASLYFHDMFISISFTHFTFPTSTARSNYLFWKKEKILNALCIGYRVAPWLRNCKTAPILSLKSMTCFSVSSQTKL